MESNNVIANIPRSMSMNRQRRKSRKNSQSKSRTGSRSRSRNKSIKKPSYNVIYNMKDFLRQSSGLEHSEILAKEESSFWAKGKTFSDDYYNKELVSKINLIEFEAFKQALELKKILYRLRYNLVSIESVTSGLIASTLTSIGQGGPALYGGFVVYDTDAKRRWVGVTTPNLYNEQTAIQMAKGALENSAAMVSLAVTGNAQPPITNLKCIGIVDIGVSVRGNIVGNNFITFHKRVNVCKDDPYCKLWIDEHNKNTIPPKYPSFSDHHFINRYVRTKIAYVAIEFCKVCLGKVNKMKYFKNFSIPEKNFVLSGHGLSKKINYLYEYGDCWEPSDIIFENLDSSVKSKIHREWTEYDESGEELCNIKRTERCPKSRLKLRRLKTTQL